MVHVLLFLLDVCILRGCEGDGTRGSGIVSSLMQLAC